MPAPSGSTPVLDLPYPTELDTPDVAYHLQLLALACETAILASGVPVGGTIGWELATLPSIGTWLFCHGQTVTTAAYPALASARPTWVSGSNIVLPDTRDKFTVGAGGSHTGGATGGGTVTLVTGNIPEFSSVALSISDPGHQHSSNENGNTSYQTVYTDPSSSSQQIGSPVGGWTGSTDVNVTFNSVNTDTTASTGISGTVTFGNASPTPVDIVPEFYAEHKIVRAA